MKFVYTKSAFEMPDGKYLAKFLGCQMRDDKPGEKPRLGNDGNPLPPAMMWNFEIADGPERGKKSDKLTGRVPTPKSGCGKMLAAIADTILKDGQEIDIEPFIGQLYRVTILDNRISDNPAPVRVYGSTVAPPPPNNSFVNHGGAVVPSAADPEARWDYSDGHAVSQNETSIEVQSHLDTIGLKADSIRAKPAGAPNAAAKPASAWGFRDGESIPF